MSTPPKDVDVSALLGEFLTDLVPNNTTDAAPLRHAAIVSAAVATARAGLEPRFRELQCDEADRFHTEPGWIGGDGVAVMCAMGAVESILDALTDAVALIASGRTIGVWLLLGHAGEQLRRLHTLVDANPESDAISIVDEARSAEIDLQRTILDALNITPGAAAGNGCPGHTAVLDTSDIAVTTLTARIDAAARAACSVLPAQVTDPTADADRIDYTQIAACTTAQAHLALDLLDLAAGGVCGYLDEVCLNPWWIPLADDVASAVAAAHDHL